MVDMGAFAKIYRAEDGRTYVEATSVGVIRNILYMSGFERSKCGHSWIRHEDAKLSSIGCEGGVFSAALD